MGRRAAPLKPRKVTVNGGQVRWEVRIPKELRKQEGGLRRFFEKEKVAQGYCNRLASDSRNYSDKAHGLTDAQKIDAQTAFERLAESPGATLLAAVEHYLAHLAQIGRSKSLEFVGSELVRQRRALGGKGSRENTISELELRWGRFVRSFPDRLASGITSEEVNTWLLDLTRPDGQPVSLDTRHGYRRVLHTHFEFALAKVRGWIISNPVAEVELPASPKKRVFLLPVPKVRQLLETAQPEMVPYFALCAFAGLRPDHAKELSWEHIHFARGNIEVPRGSDKTDPERIVPIQPVLAAWLLLTPEARRKGGIFYSKKFFRSATRAVLDPWKQDCLRHDYATYRITSGASFSDTAREMGNSEAVIRESYFRSVDPADATAYWSSFPSAKFCFARLEYWETPTAAEVHRRTGRRVKPAAAQA